MCSYFRGFHYFGGGVGRGDGGTAELSSGNSLESRNGIGCDFLHGYFSFPIFIEKVLSALMFF